jgi:hypothetical protein
MFSAPASPGLLCRAIHGMIEAHAREESAMSQGRKLQESFAAPFMLMVKAMFMVVVAVGNGCQQFSTYPPVELPVAARLQRPAAEPVPTIIARSVEYVRERFGVAGDLPLNLPEGVPASVYDKVFARLGGGEPMMQPGQRAIHIVQVRTRGMDAQVDLIYPRPDGPHQEVTLTLGHYVFQKWQVRSVRKWGVPVHSPPPPHYVAPPPPPPTPAEQEPDQTTGK